MVFLLAEALQNLQHKRLRRYTDRPLIAPRIWQSRCRGANRSVRPVTLRPQLSLGLPFTAASNDAGEYTIVIDCVNHISVRHRRQNGARGERAIVSREPRNVRSDREPRVRTIILMYHGVTAVGGGAANMHRISERCFREQMTYLKQSDYAVLPWKEMIGGRLEDDATAVGLTFDDANLSDVACARLLQLLGYSALFFVPTGYLDQDGRLSRSEVAELSDWGMGIGSHSHHHAQLARLNDSQLEEELGRSKAILEEIIKLPVEHLSFPGGSYDAHVLSVARKIGYRYFYTSEWGSNGITEAARGVLRRIPLVDGLSIEGFRDILEMRDYQKKRAQFRLKELAKRTLGERNYLRLRRALVKHGSATGEGGNAA